MNKKEFIDFLENRLSVLKKDEREDVISEYVQHIENKLAEGMGEREAVETLGNAEDLVREILSAYSVDPDYNRESESEINSFVNGVFHQVTGAVKSIGDYVVGEKISNLIMLFIKAVILFFVLIICFAIGRGILMFFCSAIGGGGYLLKSIVSFVYTIAAIPTMIYIFIRFLDYSIHRGEEGTVRTNVNNTVNSEEVKQENTNDNTNVVKPVAEKISVKTITSGNHFSFENIIKSIIIFAIKIFVILCLIPCVFTLIFTVISFGGLLIMSFAGYPFVGLTLGALGFNLVGCAIVALLVKIVFFNKGAVKWKSFIQ